MAGILARKVEMTRVIKGDRFVPITILEVPTLMVVGFKTIEKDGYEAVLVGIPKKGLTHMVLNSIEHLVLSEIESQQELIKGKRCTDTTGV